MTSTNGRRADDVQARTVAGFCKAYGIGKTAVYELLATGKLRAVKAGTRTLILETSAKDWLSSLPVPVSDPVRQKRLGANRGEQPQRRRYQRSSKFKASIANSN